MKKQSPAVEVSLAPVEAQPCVPLNFSLTELPEKGDPFWAVFAAGHQEALGVMPKVLRFGVMMLWLRELVANNSTRGIVRTGGAAAKDTGLKALLAERAAEVPLASAWRFMGVAEAVLAEFKVPASVLNKLRDSKQESPISLFAKFVSAPAAALPEPLQVKQLELWQFVSGTSQRSWLDRLKPKRKGGDNTPRDADGKRVTDPDNPADVALDIWTPILRDLELHGIEQQTWADLPEVELARLGGVLTDIQRLLREGKQRAATAA